MKILKVFTVFIVCLFIVATSIMLYAENADYTLDKEKAAAYVIPKMPRQSRGRGVHGM